jgi:hypothetical protein
MRQVTLHCGPGVSAAPEDILRVLSRRCGVTLWGILPASGDDTLLDQVGRRLGMPPLVNGPRSLFQRERDVFACFMRQAWDAAPPEVRLQVLQACLMVWDHSALAAPRLSETPQEGEIRGMMETLIRTSAGCRALATVAEHYPLTLPILPHYDQSLLGLGGRMDLGYPALFGVLTVLWRARARLLRERRSSLLGLDQQIKDTELALGQRELHLEAAPRSWALRPVNGACLVAGAAVSTAATAVMAAVTPATLGMAAAVAGAGLVWSAVASTSRTRTETDERLHQLAEHLRLLRQHRLQTEREVLELESE